MRAEILNAQELREAEPHLRPGLSGGLLVPDDAVIYPPCAARFLLEQAVALGARLEVGRRVTEIECDGVRLEDGTRLNAGVIVNAAGNVAARLTPGAPIGGRKGHLVITDRYAGFVKHQLGGAGIFEERAFGER